MNSPCPTIRQFQDSLVSAVRALHVLSRTESHCARPNRIAVQSVHHFENGTARSATAQSPSKRNSPAEGPPGKQCLKVQVALTDYSPPDANARCARNTTDTMP